MGEAIVLLIVAALCLVVSLPAIVRGRIQLGFKNHPMASELLLKSPPTERRGGWARVLGILLTVIALVLIYGAAHTLRSR